MGRVVPVLLVGFIHHLPSEADAADFIRQLVGKYVVLRPNDANAFDPNCVDGWMGSRLVCHVCARKASLVRQAIREAGRRSLMVKVEGHSLDEGFNTARCSIEVSESAIEADLLAPAKPYADWAPLFGVAPEAERQGALMALMDCLRELLQLWADGEAAVREQLLAAVADYLGLEARLFALEDRREALELTQLIGEAELYERAEWNRLRAKASADAHQSGRRALEARLWLDELKAMPQIAIEAKKLDTEGLEALRANLKAFPKALFDHYEADFALFSNNLFYHQIPAEKLRQYMAGMARYELAAERLRATASTRRAGQSQLAGQPTRSGGPRPLGIDETLATPLSLADVAEFAQRHATKDEIPTLRHLADYVLLKLGGVPVDELDERLDATDKTANLVAQLAERPMVRADNYYAPGATHDDRSRRVEMRLAEANDKPF